jgi:DNA-binding protein HU-beta
VNDLVGDAAAASRGELLELAMIVLVVFEIVAPSAERPPERGAIVTIRPFSRRIRASMKLTRGSGSDITAAESPPGWRATGGLPNMTQAQFFQAVAEGSQLSKAQVRAVFTAVEEVVTKRLKGEGKIPLGGLGAVKLVDRKARIGRNPATGEQIKIPARTAIKITPAKALKDQFNKKGKK